MKEFGREPALKKLNWPLAFVTRFRGEEVSWKLLSENGLMVESATPSSSNDHLLVENICMARSQTRGFDESPATTTALAV